MTGFIVIGINHKTATVEIREGFSFTSHRLISAQNQFKMSNEIRGSVILSTCNRMEIYASSFSNEACIKYLIEFLTERFGKSWEDLKEYFYILENEEAVRHIFKVACGLDSQVLGEVEILGQVKKAHMQSCELGFTNDYVDAIFEKAVLVGVSARRETRISQGKVSTGSVAMEMLRNRFKSLKDKTVLVIGSGKIANLVSKYLKEEKVRGFFVSNRTYRNACSLARRCGGGRQLNLTDCLRN